LNYSLRGIFNSVADKKINFSLSEVFLKKRFNA